MTTDWQALTPRVDEPGTFGDYWGTFKVGDRVRVRLTAECPGYGGKTGSESGTGRVTDVLPDGCSGNHPYGVVADDGSGRFGYCAAVELELITDD